MFAKVAQVQFRAVLDALNEQVNRLGQVQGGEERAEFGDEHEFSSDEHRFAPDEHRFSSSGASPYDRR
jgi:hypothetical protein